MFIPRAATHDMKVAKARGTHSALKCSGQAAALPAAGPGATLAAARQVAAAARLTAGKNLHDLYIYTKS